MYISSVSFSYFTLVISMISFFFAVYFKTLVMKTSPDSKTREKIIGSMKDPLTWRKMNNTAGNLSIFWCLVSMIFFIYFKFLFVYSVIYIYYAFAYIAAIGLSMLFIKSKDKYTA